MEKNTAFQIPLTTVKYPLNISGGGHLVPSQLKRYACENPRYNKIYPGTLHIRKRQQRLYNGYTNASVTPDQQNGLHDSCEIERFMLHWKLELAE